MSAPPPHTHISTGRTNSELNRVAPGSTSATSGATNTSVMAGKTRFQTEATAPSVVDMSTPQQRTRPGSYSCRNLGILPNPRAPAEAPAGPVVTSLRGRRLGTGLVDRGLVKIDTRNAEAAPRQS